MGTETLNGGDSVEGYSLTPLAFVIITYFGAKRLRTIQQEEQLQYPKPAAYGIRCVRIQLQRLAGNGSSATDTLNTNGGVKVGWVKPRAFWLAPLERPRGP